jgi:hypothetical protein
MKWNALVDWILGLNPWLLLGTAGVLAVALLIVTGWGAVRLGRALWPSLRARLAARRKARDERRALEQRRLEVAKERRSLNGERTRKDTRIAFAEALAELKADQAAQLEEVERRMRKVAQEQTQYLRLKEGTPEPDPATVTLLEEEGKARRVLMAVAEMLADSGDQVIEAHRQLVAALETLMNAEQEYRRTIWGESGPHRRIDPGDEVSRPAAEPPESAA